MPAQDASSLPDKIEQIKLFAKLTAPIERRYSGVNLQSWRDSRKIQKILTTPNLVKYCIVFLLSVRL